MNKWRRAAVKAIEDAVAKGIDDGLTGPELEAYVRANGYPFGERAMHPYKIWCSAMRERFGSKRSTGTNAKVEAYDAWIAEIRNGLESKGAGR